MRLALRPGRRWNLPAMLFLLGLLCHSAYSQAAECSDSKVRRLSNKGETAKSIADACDMDIEDVKALLKRRSRPKPEEASDEIDDDKGLPRGTPLSVCACWGPVSVNHRESAPNCRSGFAVPRACPAMCPSGGYAWQGVCG